MGLRNTTDLEHLTPDIVVISGSFAPNGSSAVSATSRLGVGWSVVRTNTGVFTVTFTDKWARLVYASAHLRLATAADQHAMLGAYVAASKTLVINIWDISGAAVADIAANADNVINFECHFQRSTLLPARGT